MKHIKVIPIFICLILLMAVNIVNAEFQMSSPVVRGNEIIIDGNVKEIEKTITFLVVKSGGDVNDTNDILTVGQVKSDADGNFQVKIEMDDSQSGKYNIILHSNNTSDYNTSVGFIYINEEIMNQLLADLTMKTAEEIEYELSINKDYQYALESQGLAIEQFLSVNQNERIEYIKDIGHEVESVKDFAEKLNIRLLFNELNNKKNISENLNRINLTFEEQTFDKFTDNEQAMIVKLIEKRLPVENWESLINNYNNCVVLMKFNFARYSDIDSLMEKYKTELGLDNSAAYNTYLGFSQKDKQSTQEIVVKNIDKNTVFTNENYSSILINAVNTVKNKNSSSGGTGGGGGSSTSKNAYTEDVVSNVVGIIQDTSMQDNETVSFTDIDDVPWAKNEIIYLAQKGIVSGTEKGTFLPNEIITREAFVKLAVEADGVHNETAVCGFEDVVKGSWYESYIASAYEHGLITGQSDKIFGVGSAITREDVCVIAAKLLKNKSFESNITFNDETEISDYAVESVKILAGKKIISGMGNNEFKPKEVCTRAQAAKIIYGVLMEGSL